VKRKLSCHVINLPCIIRAFRGLSRNFLSTEHTEVHGNCRPTREWSEKKTLLSCNLFRVSSALSADPLLILYPRNTRNGTETVDLLEKDLDMRNLDWEEGVRKLSLVFINSCHVIYIPRIFCVFRGQYLILYPRNTRNGTETVDLQEWCEKKTLLSCNLFPRIFCVFRGLSRNFLSTEYTERRGNSRPTGKRFRYEKFGLRGGNIL
jgi:hypothetical protein